MELRQQLHRDIELLPESVLQAFVVIAREHIALNRKQSNDIGEKRRATFGCMKGKSWIADDFNAPLEEMKEYME